MTRATGPAHIARAALEAVCYQSAELLEAMADDVGKEVTTLRVDGGMVRNDWLTQYLADITKTPVGASCAFGDNCTGGRTPCRP